MKKPWISLQSHAMVWISRPSDEGKMFDNWNQSVSRRTDLCQSIFPVHSHHTPSNVLPRLAFESLLARYWRNRARLSNHSVHHRPIVTNQLISFCLRIRMSRADTDSLVLYELNFDARWCIWSIDQTCWGLDKMQSTAPEFESLGERSKIVVFVNM